MVDDGDTRELVERLQQTGMSPGEAERLVADVLAHFTETTEDFVRRRHRELQRRGVRNAQSYAVIGRELAQRRVRPPRLSERQIRRVIYG
jgi:uncharacterized protein YoaH (UPF0181 family)